MTTSQINPNQLRPAGNEPGRIIQVGPQRRPEAIERLVSGGLQADRDHARRFLDYAQFHRIRLDGMWSRLDRSGRIEATVLAVPSPGRTAMVFASRIGLASQIDPMAELIDHACRQLVGMDVNLAQTLLDPGESLIQQMFMAGGFLDLAVLSYLERSVRPPRSPQTPSPQWSDSVSIVRFDDSMRDELLDVLDRSYEQTLDCPGLQGHRKTEDILEGHRASGVFDPSLWTILRINGVASGVLLLNPSADLQTIELVYLGLAKSARGQGLGRQLLRHGLRLVEQRSERTINLAVDESNAPAIALYTREGFRSALRRAAMIRPLPQHAAAK